MPNAKVKEKQSEILASLKQWGIDMGNNLLVADWDIGHKPYRDLAKIANIRRFPAVVITDDHKIKEESFKIVMEGSSVVNNFDILTDYLKRIVNDIFKGDRKEAIKDAVKAGQAVRINSIINPLKSFYNRLEVIRIMGYGLETEVELRATG